MTAPGIKSRLILSALLANLLVLAGLGAYLHFATRRSLLESTIRGLDGQALLVSQQVAAIIAAGSAADLDGLADSQAALLGRRVTIIDRTGRVLGDSEKDGPELTAMDNHAGRPEIVLAESAGTGRAVRHSRTLGVEEIYIARTVTVGNRIWGYCRIAWPMREFAAFQLRLAGALAIGLLCAALLLLLLEQRVWSSILRSIQKVEAAAARIAGGDLAARAGLDPASPEISQVARTLNLLAEQWDRSARELSERSAQLAAVLDGMSEGVIVIDESSRVTMTNRAAGSMFGCDPIQARGRQLLEVVRYPLAEPFARGGEGPVELPLGGQTFLVHASPLAGDGRRGGAVLVFSDITHLKRLEAVRRDFVANVSHELKTPLAAVAGSVEALLDGAQHDPKQRGEFLERIRRQAVRMEKIVRDLLDLAALESGGYVPDLRPVAVRELIDRAVDALSRQLREKGMAAIVAGPALDLMVLADEDKAVQALVNLLDNAVKHSPPGSAVTVAAEAEGAMARLSVGDAGPGIPSQHLPRLFERFYRADTARSRQLGGTGLGLAIVRHIAEIHGGTAGVDSEVGRGSRFWLRLPLAGVDKRDRNG